MAKRTKLKQITLKKSESLFHKKQIDPVTLHLKTTFSSVTLFLSAMGAKERRMKVRKSEFSTLLI